MTIIKTCCTLFVFVLSFVLVWSTAGCSTLTEQPTAIVASDYDLQVSQDVDSDWTEASPPSSPSARGYTAMAYDAESDVVILFGGYEGGQHWSTEADTWAYDASADTWTDMAPSSAPPGLGGHAMTYDSKNDRVILFAGGNTSNIDTGETWAYDHNSNTWINRTPTLSPPPRSGHKLVYDSQSELVILWGGQVWGIYEETYARQDTWTYNYDTNTWTNVTTAESPLRRRFFNMVYDEHADRTILFGGFGTDLESPPSFSQFHDFRTSSLAQQRTGFIGDTWTFDLDSNTWTNVTPEISPAARGYSSMVYDSKANRTILFGGHNEETSSLYRDTWAFNSESNTWTNMNSPSPPIVRLRHSMVFNSKSNRSILFGGAVMHFDFRDGTWIYEYMQNPTPTTSDGTTTPPPITIPAELMIAAIGVPAVVVVVLVIWRTKKK
ncbi:MAG: Kelch repeat-containing protein [Candidatus Thorarchaeota archaeon]